jgi:hypothetical protein
MQTSKRRSTYAIMTVLTMVLWAGLLFISKEALAAETESKEAVQFNVNTSLADNLAALKGKTVTVALSSGQTITGIVGDVKGNLLHLVKLSQRDFYDALLVIDHISAIETKVR